MYSSTFCPGGAVRIEIESDRESRETARAHAAAPFSRRCIISQFAAPAFRAPGDRVAAERRAKPVAKPGAPRNSTRRNGQNRFRFGQWSAR